MKSKKNDFFLLRLYVAGESANSLKAISNLNSICKEYLTDRHKVEIVDILDDPAHAFEDGVLVTPALVKMDPLPICQIVGDLSEREKVLFALGDLKNGTIRKKKAG